MLEKERILLRGKVKISNTSLDKYKREKNTLYGIFDGSHEDRNYFFFKLVNEDDWSLKEINKEERRMNLTGSVGIYCCKIICSYPFNISERNMINIFRKQ